jgi:hypothetical protein
VSTKKGLDRYLCNFMSPKDESLDVYINTDFAASFKPKTGMNNAFQYSEVKVRLHCPIQLLSCYVGIKDADRGGLMMFHIDCVHWLITIIKEQNSIQLSVKRAQRYRTDIIQHILYNTL